MSELILAFMLGICGLLIGWAHGTEAGRVQIHTGEYVCQTLPDDTIYCWRAKNK